MTPNQRRRYSQQYQNMVKAYEERYVGRVYSALKRQVSSFTDVIKTRGTAAATSLVTIDLFNELLLPVIRSLYMDAGLSQATKTRGELRTEQLRHVIRLKERFPDHEFTVKRFGYNAEL